MFSVRLTPPISGEIPVTPFPRGSAYERPQPLPTGFCSLDALLEGGFPQGWLVEISGSASSGKATLAFGCCLTLLAKGKAVCWIDAGTYFWPIAALELQKPLDRFFVLRVPDGEAALYGAHILLGCSGAVALVVLDLPAYFKSYDSQLLKLQRLAERSGSGLLFLTERSKNAPSLGASIALRLHVHRRFIPSGSTLSIEILRHKAGPTHRSVEEPVYEPNRLRVDSTL